MEDKRYLTFALGKGRLAKKTLELFEKIGITCEEIKDPDTRKLIFVNEELKLRFFLAKGPDVPTYCLLYTSDAADDSEMCIRDRYLHMWNMEPQISELSAKIRF